MPRMRNIARRARWLFIALAAVGVLGGLVFVPVATAASGDFVISGRGYGQGQGMSQWGAWTAARQGRTYQQILAFYYPGTKLTTLASAAPSRETITVRITTSGDTFSQVRLTAAATSAALLDSTGVTIGTLALGDSVTLSCNAGKVQVNGSVDTYDYLELRPDSTSGRVTVAPTPLWSGGDRSYWGVIRVKADASSGRLLVHNILPIDKFVAGVAEISPDWAKPSSPSYYALEAVKAQAVAARTYIAAHGNSVPYDDTRDMVYVGYDYEAKLPGVARAAQETAGAVLTYGGKLIVAHFSSSSGGYTSNSAWSGSGQIAYEPAQPDPWSITSPPNLPAYAWAVTVSPADLARELRSKLNVGTITQVDVIERDTSDANSHARTLSVTGTTGTATIAARTFKSLVGLRSTLILNIAQDDGSGGVSATIPTDSPAVGVISGANDDAPNSTDDSPASSSTTTPAHGPTRYQETDLHLSYAGSWTALPDVRSSRESYRLAETDGASVIIKFTGTYLAWIATEETTSGTAGVSLDGGIPVLVDLTMPKALVTYPASYQQRVWATGVLKAGAHTVRIWWNPANRAGETISIDAVDVIGTLN
jgi:SpoIID/LytB domain protein